MIAPLNITLIALVVTLVVLLILAGVTINIMISEGGILGKAQTAKEKQEVAEMLEKLTVAEASTATNYLAVDLEKYKAELKAQGIVKQDESNYIVSADGLSYELTSGKGYVFTVTEPTKGDIVIVYEGKEGQLPPKIIDIKAIEKTASSIKTQVNVIRLENGKLSYYYKKHAEENYTTLKENTTDKTVNYTGLTQNETYDLKLIATNKNGSVEQKISVVTGELPEGTISQKGSTTWSAGKASIELQTTDIVNNMQYQKNDINGNWTNYTTAITGLVHGDIIYARMYDGVNGSSTFSVDVLDDIQAQTATISLSKTTTEPNTTITATVTQIDNESGVDITKCKWVYNITNTEIETDESSYTGGAFNTNPQMINLNTSTVGTYYVHVLTIDKAGNKKETVSSAVEIKQLATGISLNQTSTIMYAGNTLTLTATVIPSNTENKNVTWASSDQTVATVTNGIVTAKSEGITIITATTQDGSNKIATCSITVKKLAITDIKAGDWITYTGGGYSKWRVLWEANNSVAGNGNSIQIISTGSVKNVTLGSGDFNTAKNSYNNAIITLNNEANAYINSTYANNARCVGSVPNNKNAEATTYFTSSYSYMSPYNGQFKNTDTNYEKDYNQIGKLGIKIINSNYWIDSRNINVSPDDIFCTIRQIDPSAGLIGNAMSYVKSNGRGYGMENTHGFRPVVSLKPDIKITGGDGSQESPWQLGI